MEVDLNAACRTFERLVEVHWIKNSINLNPLLDILLIAAPSLRSPEILLLLPTCPLLHEDQNFKMVLLLAVTIRNLNETVMKSLRGHWSSLKAALMLKHIRMWKKAVIFLLRSNLWLNFAPGVKASLDVLKELYKVNKKAEKSRKVPFCEFYIEELRTIPYLLHQDIQTWWYIKSGAIQDDEHAPVVFCCYPFLLDLESKISFFKWHSFVIQNAHKIVYGAVNLFEREFMQETPTPFLMLKLRRTALLEDTFRHLEHADHENFKKELVVQFVEESKLTLVNQKDFFLHAFNELVAPESQMFMYNENQTLLWFPAQPTHELRRYFLFGILCGLALYNNNVVHMPFPLAMFKKLVNVKPTLEDLREFSPILGRCLHLIRSEYPDDVVDDLNITFCVNWDGAEVELDPQMRGRAVTKDNKTQYVDAHVDYVLNRSVEQVFQEFRRGFYKVCERDVVEFFQPEELRGVMVGTEQYDWDLFKQNTQYDGLYHVTHPTVLTFWAVFEELTEEQKKAFLLFLTGCDRVPVLGMGQVRMTMMDRPNFTQNHLPESQTCHSNLLLPPYESRDRLKDKLTEALNHNRGFWKE